MSVFIRFLKFFLSLITKKRRCSQPGFSKFSLRIYTATLGLSNPAIHAYLSLHSMKGFDPGPFNCLYLRKSSLVEINIEEHKHVHLHTCISLLTFNERFWSWAFQLLIAPQVIICRDQHWRAPSHWRWRWQLVIHRHCIWCQSLPWYAYLSSIIPKIINTLSVVSHKDSSGYLPFIWKNKNSVNLFYAISPVFSFTLPHLVYLRKKKHWIWIRPLICEEDKVGIHYCMLFLYISFTLPH